MTRNIQAAAVVSGCNAGFCIIDSGKSHISCAVIMLGRTFASAVMTGGADRDDTGERIVNSMVSAGRWIGMAGDTGSGNRDGAWSQRRMTAVAAGADPSGQMKSMTEGTAVAQIACA